MVTKKRKRSEIVKSPESQWEEALRLINEIDEVIIARNKRLLVILGMNQNPGGGGDGSIDEGRWNVLRARMQDLGLYPK